MRNRYLNPGGSEFKSAIEDEIYVDKTMIISELNKLVGKKSSRFVCMTRPRRFGKSYVGDLICAYYSRNCDSRALFDGLKLSQDPSFEMYLNKLDVIRIDLVGFYSNYPNERDNLIQIIASKIAVEFREQFPDIEIEEKYGLADILQKVYKYTGRKFVVFIDEYDVLIREKASEEQIKRYLDFLNGLFKDVVTQEAITLAYITGILPIVREKIQSKLNVFREYNFLRPGPFIEFMGFTEEETKELCERYDMNFEECKVWYDGYHLKNTEKEISVFSPKSVTDALTSHEFGDYWSQTSTFEVVTDAMLYSNIDFKETILKLIDGKSEDVDITRYNNTMEFSTKDDVLTFCILLGYLNYNKDNETCNIPNSELRKQWEHVASEIESTKVVATLLKDSHNLLQATIARDTEKVAEGLEKAHDIVASINGYNNESGFQTAITYAYYYAQNTYTLIREFPTGTGFADVAFIPKYPSEKYPAFIVELKVNGSTETAMKQIEDRKYGSNLLHYRGNMLLVTVNYDASTTGKKHSCQIKEFVVE